MPKYSFQREMEAGSNRYYAQYRQGSARFQSANERSRRRRLHGQSVNSSSNLPRIKNLTVDGCLRWYKTNLSLMGSASGVDGVSPEDFTNVTLAKALRLAIPSLVAGTFKPNAYRTVEIPKPNGDTRRISIPTVVERVIAGYINDLLMSYIVARLLPIFHGSIPGKSPTMLFAALFHDHQESQGELYFSENDIYKAFDNLPLETALANLLRIGIPEKFVDVIRRLMTPANSSSTTYLPQGCALSPTLFTTTLSEHFRPGNDHGETGTGLQSRYVYVDNTLVVGPNAESLTRTISFHRERLAGLGLLYRSENDEIINVNKREMTFLGTKIRRLGNQLRFEATKESIADLMTNLRECITSCQIKTQAESILIGWLSNNEHVLGTANDIGTVTSPLQERTERIPELRNLNWERIRDKARDIRSRWETRVQVQNGGIQTN